MFNPTYKYQGNNKLDLDELLAGFTKGDINSLARAISLAESTKTDDRAIINKLLLARKAKEKSKRIAITGSPGAGKSTLINSLVSRMAKPDHKIAVLAIDPSSELSSGSILGDKTRMEQLIGNQNVFVRPIASGHEQGGIAESTYRSILLCEAAGYKTVFIETVGVGQSAYEASKAVDFFLLVLNPAAGDELQGIKRGIVEMADLIVVNKADGALIDHAKITQKAYQHALHLNLSSEEGWSTKVEVASAIDGLGIDQIIDIIENYFLDFLDSDKFMLNRRTQEEYWFKKELNTLLMERLLKDGLGDLKIAEIWKAVKEGSKSYIESIEEIRKRIDE